MCMRVLKAVNPMVLIVHTQKAQGKMARPIQMIPPTPTHPLHPHPLRCPFVPALSTHAHPHPNFRDIW